MSERWRIGFSAVAGGAGPHCAVRTGRSFHPPFGLVFNRVVCATSMAEVVYGGGSAVGPGAGVVKITVGCASPAAGEVAGVLLDGKPSFQCGGNSILPRIHLKN